MGLLTNKLPQKATWWRTIGSNGFGGDVVAPPVLLSVRWEDRQEKFSSSVNRQELVSNAVVYLDRDVSVGDYLALGNQLTQNDPSVVPGASKIERFDKMPDLRNLDSVRRAIL